MDKGELQAQIKQLLAQDVMLEQSFKASVIEKMETLSAKQLQNIIVSLQKLVDQEQAIIAQTLDKKPFLFNQIQHEILGIMHAEFLKIEAVNKAEAETELQENLKNVSS